MHQAGQVHREVQLQVGEDEVHGGGSGGGTWTTRGVDPNCHPQVLQRQGHNVHRRCDVVMLSAACLRFQRRVALGKYFFIVNPFGQSQVSLQSLCTSRFMWGNIFPRLVHLFKQVFHHWFMKRSPFLMFDIKRTPIQSPYSTYQHLFILCYLLSIFHLADINMITLILKLLY